MKPPRSGPSETALRLRSFPRRGPAAGAFLKLLKKINLVSNLKMRGELKLNVEREIRVLSVQPNVILD